MIRIKLSAILGERRISQSALAKSLEDEGLKVSRSAIGNLYREDAKELDLKVLDKICAYLNVQPGDLLKWEPDPDEEEHVAPLKATHAKRQPGNTKGGVGDK